MFMLMTWHYSKILWNRVLIKIDFKNGYCTTRKLPSGQTVWPCWQLYAIFAPYTLLYWSTEAITNLRLCFTAHMLKCWCIPHLQWIQPLCRYGYRRWYVTEKNAQGEMFKYQEENQERIEWRNGRHQQWYTCYVCKQIFCLLSKFPMI